MRASRAMEVIGLIGSTAGLTPYALRQEFRLSPAPYWSGSAGAIYPLVRRLSDAGLLKSTAVRTGNRHGTVLSLTSRGRRALDQWLNVELDDATIGIPMDPLRLRMRFLYTLPPSRRSALVERARQRAQIHLQRIEEDCRTREAEGNLADYLMARGALLMMQARLAWLDELRKLFGLSDNAARRMAWRPSI